MVTLHLLVVRCGQCVLVTVSAMTVSQCCSAAAAAAHDDDPSSVPPVAATRSVSRPIRHRPDWTAVALLAIQPHDMLPSPAASVTPSLVKHV